MNTITPRDYQEAGVNKLIGYIGAGYKRGIFQLATGGGKTICLSYLLQRYLRVFPFNRCTVLVHREELREQTLATLAKFNIYNVSVSMIETFYNRIRRSPEHYDMIIIDECHIGNFKKIFEHYTETVIIGFSATPKSASKKHPLCADYQFIVCGIDTHELIASGNLVKARYFSPDTELNKKVLKKSRGEFNLSQMGQAFSNPKLVDAVLHSYQEHAPNTKSIIYNTTIEHSLKVHDCLASAGLPSRHLDSFATKEEREDALLWLKHTPNAILNNVGILTTGFDEPSVETIVVNRCTESLPLWLQMCGRGARPYPGKGLFTIMDLGQNIDVHGLWHEKRDWEGIFFNPDSPGDGVAPVKECPECLCMIHASATICEFCGHKMPRETVYSDDPVVLSLVEKLDTGKIVKQTTERGYKSTVALYKIIEHVKRAGIDEETAQQVFEVKLNEYYQQENRPLKDGDFNYWMKKFKNYTISHAS